MLRIHLLLFFLLLVVSKVSFAEETFVRSYFDSGRSFYVTAPDEGEWVESDNFKVFLFSSAQASCQLLPQELSNKLSAANQHLVKRINSYFPKLLANLNRRHIYVTVDSYEHFSNAANAFASFYLRDVPSEGEGLISLNCILFQGEQWQGYLAHELVHAFFSPYAMASWMEELIAQNLEYEVRGALPAQRLAQLGSAVLIPSPVSASRPFISSEMYASNFLLGQYIKQRWGGQSTLRAFFPETPVAVCAPDFTLSSLTCRMRALMLTMKAPSPLMERATPEGLLRHYAIALELNQYTSTSLGLYSIQGWKGFTSQPLDSFAKLDLVHLQLEQGSFLRLTPRLWQEIKSKMSTSLESYRVVKFVDGSYNLFSGSSDIDKSFAQNQLKKKSVSDTVIVLNVNDGLVSLF